MDIKIKLELSDESEVQDNVTIKQEKEPLIESETEWLPTQVKDESSYYQAFLEGRDGYFEEPSYDIYTIQYMDDEDYGEEYEDEEENDESNANINFCESDVDDDEVGMDVDNNLDIQKQVENLEKETKDESLMKDVCIYSLNKFLNKHYIKRKCQVCEQHFGYHYEWRTHVLLKHSYVIKKSQNNYVINNGCGVCKICNREFGTDFQRYLHSVRHSNKDGYKIDINICSICNFGSSNFAVIQKHIVEKHPETLDEFQKSNANKLFKCPICDCTYSKYNYLSNHITDKHPEEIQDRFHYKCHLCTHDQFSEEKTYFKHLIDEHEYNSPTVLNSCKIFDDKNFLSCLKCHKIFLENDEKLLKHFLEHNNDIMMCKFCNKNYTFRKGNYGHLCIKMMRNLAQNKNEINKTSETCSLQEKKNNLKNLQEFEGYIAHVCPFCQKEFDKMPSWQQHLKKIHQIDTLKGLEMQVIPNDDNKLRCQVCHTMVSNTTEELQAHRFHHLPYQPYKCWHCLLPLSTFKIAVNHVIKRCKDQEDRDKIKNLINNVIKPVQDINTMIAIQCSFCNRQKFGDIKSILKHYEDEHNNFENFYIKQPGKSIICKICQKVFLNYDEKTCIDHLQYHLDEKIFKCKLCDYSYAKFKTCYQHLLKKHYVKPLNKLELIENSNARQTSLYVTENNKVTVNIHTPQLAKCTLKSHVLNEFAEFLNFACPECNEGMTKHEDWYTHISTKHNFFDQSNIYYKDVDGSIKCSTCNLKLPNNTMHQQKHKLTHMPYRSFICNLCYARTNTLGVLYGHFRRKHFAHGSFQCPLCSDILTTEHQRTVHIKEKHPRQEWPSSMCLICYKILSHKSSLTSHMTTHNADRVKHTCEVCGAKLICIKDFKLHTARHELKGETKKLGGSNENNLTSEAGSQEIDDENVDKDKNLCEKK